MEHTIKLPKHLNYKNVSNGGIPEPAFWAVDSGKEYQYLCRARDNDNDGNTFSYWKTGLFAGGHVELGSIQYRIFDICSTDGKSKYNDEYTLKYDEVQFIEIPCIFFGCNDVPYTGYVIGFYKDGSCAVMMPGDTAVTKVEASKVKYISDILEME